MPDCPTTRGAAPVALKLHGRCRPVCTMYGLDIGYGGDFGAVTQKLQALVMLACSAPLLQLEPACLFANATEDAEGGPCHCAHLGARVYRSHVALGSCSCPC